MVAIVIVGRQSWIQPPGKEGWERSKIEGQCFHNNLCFCLTLRFGKDHCFFMNYSFSSSQAVNWVEIISSLLYILLSGFCLFGWLYICIYLCTHTHTHTHDKTQQTSTHRLTYDFWQVISHGFLMSESRKQSGSEAVHEKHPLSWPTHVLPLYYFITFCPSEFCSYSFKIINLFSCAFPIQIGLQI